MNNKIIIVGAGASGLMAAITASSFGGKVTVLEKTNSAGKKILASGNGRCNLTNSDMSKYMYNSNDISRVEKALGLFGYADTIRFFEGIGLVVKNIGGYIYPFSQQSSSVLDVLMLQAKKNGVEFVFECGVNNIDCFSNGYKLSTEKGEFICDKLIIATGSRAGVSKKDMAYKGTDGFELTKKLGIPHSELMPGLVQIKCKEKYFENISGVRCDCTVTLYADDNAVAREEGELQITSSGISGIPAFQISRYVNAGNRSGKVMRAVIDLLPQLDEDEFESFISNRILSNKNATVRDFMTGLINNKLIDHFITQSDLKSDSLISDNKIEDIVNLMYSLKQWVVECIDTFGFDKAQVCCGGVEFSEVDDYLESVIHKNLFICGELLDVDGKCGGYNLQWAWTSGYIAGRTSTYNG